MADLSAAHAPKKTVMKVGLIVDPYGEKSPGGLGRAIFEMAKALIVQGGQNEYVVYTKKESSQPLSFSGSKWNHVALEVRYLWLSAGRAFDRTLDAYLFYTPIIPIFFFPKRSIVVVYDFAYLELPRKSFKDFLSTYVLYCLHWISFRKATHIIAISEATKQGTVKHFHISPEKISVIYPGYIAFMSEPKKIETPSKFFLFAGVLKQRKNVAGVIQAFEIFARTNSDYHMLIAGKKGGRYYDQMLALTQELGVEDRVTFLGYVEDAELGYLYSKATALVFPSFIEGFGMPVLEAMEKELPVITSNTGALAEVAGDAALLVDPHNPASIAEAMDRLAKDESLRERCISMGKKQAHKFSWDASAKNFVDVIAKLGHTTAI
jgi:glycosyltransferase involved in cell wall biosynthesis